MPFMTSISIISFKHIPIISHHICYICHFISYLHYIRFIPINTPFSSKIFPLKAANPMDHCRMRSLLNDPHGSAELRVASRSGGGFGGHRSRAKAETWMETVRGQRRNAMGVCPKMSENREFTWRCGWNHQSIEPSQGNLSLNNEYPSGDGGRWDVSENRVCSKLDLWYW